MGRHAKGRVSWRNSRTSRRNIINNQGYSGRYKYYKVLQKKEKNQLKRSIKRRKEMFESFLIALGFVLFVVLLCLLN